MDKAIYGRVDVDEIKTSGGNGQEQFLILSIQIITRGCQRGCYRRWNETRRKNEGSISTIHDAILIVVAPKRFGGEM